MGRDRLRRRWELYLSEWEVISIFLCVEFFSCSIDAFNHKNAAKRIDVAGWGDLIASQVVIANEGLSWLVDVKAVRKFLSTEEKSKGIAAIIRVMNFTDFDSVIGQVVVYYERQVAALCKEAKYLAIVIQELLL